MPEAAIKDRPEMKPRLHGELLSTSLLAFLKNWNAYGYQLTQRLADSGMPECDSGTVYRTLRQLEKSGFVSSFWDTSESGPARRMYSLTQTGDLFLSVCISACRELPSLGAAPAGRGDPDGSVRCGRGGREVN